MVYYSEVFSATFCDVLGCVILVALLVFVSAVVGWFSSSLLLLVPCVFGLSLGIMGLCSSLGVGFSVVVGLWNWSLELLSLELWSLVLLVS